MEKKRPGQRFKPPKAADWNRLCATADLVSRQSGSIDGANPQGPWLRAGEANPILIRNQCGAVRSIGDVLKLDDLQTTVPNKYRTIIDGIVSDGLRSNFGILQATLENGAIGEACISGACWATVNVVSSYHTRAYPEKDSYVLKSGYAGPVSILYKPASTGNQTCLIRWDAWPKVYAHSGSGISAATKGASCAYSTPASATCNIWGWDATNSRYAPLAAGTATATIYNFFATAIPDNRLMICSPGDDWRLTVDTADCTDCATS
jgi:hypothetical protein